jgi:hypothetical protein
MGMQRKKSRARVGTGPDSLAQNMLNPYLVGSSNGVAVRKKSGGVHGWWKGFDSKFMKPLFGGTDPSLRRDRDRDEAGNNSGNNNTNKMLRWNIYVVERTLTLVPVVILKSILQVMPMVKEKRVK